MYGYIISPDTPSCGRLWQTRAAASVNLRHAGHMDAFSPQSFADALECVVAATPVQRAGWSSACCMNIVWEGKQHTIPGRLTLKPCLIWAIYGFLLLNDINRKSLWSQRVCGVHVGFFSSVCLRLKTSLASDFINQSCLCCNPPCRQWAEFLCWQCNADVLSQRFVHICISTMLRNSCIRE